MLNRRFADFYGLLIGKNEAVYCRKNNKNQTLNCHKGGAVNEHLSMLFRTFAVYIKLRLMEQPWPFDQPPNCGVITLRQIMEHGKPILLVSHDEDDHGWQFLDGSENPDQADAVHVCLSHVVETDQTLIELADLPLGWQAWRPSPQDKWVREPCSEVGNEA